MTWKTFRKPRGKKGLPHANHSWYVDSHALLPNRFVNQLVNPPPLPPSPRLDRRLLDCPSSGVGDRRGEIRGESRVCKEDNEDRPLRAVRAKLWRRWDLGWSGLSWITTGFSQVPSPPLWNMPSAESSQFVHTTHIDLRYVCIDATPAMWASVMLGQPCMDAVEMKPVRAW